MVAGSGLQRCALREHEMYCRHKMAGTMVRPGTAGLEHDDPVAGSQYKLNVYAFGSHRALGFVLDKATKTLIA